MPYRPMMFSLVASVSAFLIAGPLATDAVSAPSEPLRLERFFLGPLDATGRFRSRLAGVDRGFTVKAEGRMDGDVLVLVEDFLFEDGATDRKTWRFTKVGPGRYEGTREDVVGTASVVERDGRIFMSYLIDLPNNGDTMRVRFSDVLYYGEDGEVINRARVSKFGFPVAGVEVIFTK